MVSPWRIVLFLGLFCGCSSRSPRTVDDVVSEAREEFEILAPSLKAAAEAWILPFAAQGLEFAGVPSIRCEQVDRHSDTFKSPDGTQRREFGTRTYKLQAVETVCRYRVGKVESVARTGTPDKPFVGIVGVEVEMVERKSDPVRREVKDPVPAGWTPLDSDNEREVIVLREAKVEVRQFGPLPLPPVPATLPQDLPALDRHELDVAAQQVVDACLKSTPSTSRPLAPLKFWLAADRKRWVR